MGSDIIEFPQSHECHDMLVAVFWRALRKAVSRGFLHLESCEALMARAVDGDCCLVRAMIEELLDRLASTSGGPQEPRRASSMSSPRRGPAIQGGVNAQDH